MFVVAQSSYSPPLSGQTFFIITNTTATVGAALHHYRYVDQDTFAAASRVTLSRFSATGTTPTNQASEKTNQLGRAAVSAVEITAATTPGKSGNPVVIQPYNQSTTALGLMCEWRVPRSRYPYVIPVSGFAGISMAGDVQPTPVITGVWFSEDAQLR